MTWFDSITKSITVFREDENGNIYPVELSKEKAWYIGPTANEFSHLSAEYIKSSAALIQLNKDIGESFGAVPAYLALHGLELKLKGALHVFDANTYTVRKLRFDLGHRINDLLTEYHKHFDSLLEQFKKEKQEEISEVFDSYATKHYEYLDDRHNEEGSPLVVNFELIEEVVFTIIDTINIQLNNHFDSID